jgi:glycosyltransferase involved in cell wall biosynthesis
MLAKVGAVLDRNIPNSALLILTPYDKRELEAEFLRAGLEPERVRIMTLVPGDVPRYLCAADFGLVPMRAMDGSDPANVVADTMIGLKIAEYMAAGLPVIVNNRVGGLRSLMSSFKIGVGFDIEDLEAIVPKVKDMIGEYEFYQQSCRRVSERFLSLDVAVGSYYDVYRRVLYCDREH